ncbi:MAG: ATP-binding protein, partial [Bacteroidetes bacterium]|nr:ATP-binding protein [Bacteroidota bacterium]
MKPPNNPFVINAYQGKEYFCDREHDLKKLFHHVENDRNVVLYAWRRMGKSALIHRFIDDLVDTQVYETIYVDFLATHSVEEAINAIAIAIYEKYGKTKSGFSATLQRLFSLLGVTLSLDPYTGAPEISIGLRNPGMNEYSLQALGEFLRERKKRVLITIDEFQQVSRYEEGNAEAMMRTWIQHFPDIRFIFSGSHRTMMVEMFAENDRPFYQSAQLMALDPIPLEAYIPFIQKHFEAKKKFISTELIQKIHVWARGQTYAIQLVCNHLFSQYSQVKDEDFIRVVSDILGQHQSIYGSFAKMLTLTQWNLFKAIAKEEPLYS